MKHKSIIAIQCRACGSQKVEYNGDIEATTGYYYLPELEGQIIIKCHNCGNAMVIDHKNIN